MKVEIIEAPTNDPIRDRDKIESQGAERIILSDRIHHQIAQQPFFKGLSDQQIQMLADSAMEIQFEAGQWIYRQGDLANRFYLILEGKVLLESEMEEHGIVPIRTLGPGEDLGWAWLFPPFYMHFSAQAIEPVKAIFFYGTRLRQQCEESHVLGYELMTRIAEIVIQNLHATQQRLMECVGPGISTPKTRNEFADRKILSAHSE